MKETFWQRRKELEAKIEALEESLTQLKQQLQKEREAEQHASIDHLEEYFQEVSGGFSTFSRLWTLARQEFHDFFQGKGESSSISPKRVERGKEKTGNSQP